MTDFDFTPEQLDAIRQEHEAFLADLEGLAVEALAGGDWSEVYAHIAIAGTTDLSDCKPTKSSNSRITKKMPALTNWTIPALTFSHLQNKPNDRRFPS